MSGGVDWTRTRGSGVTDRRSCYAPWDVKLHFRLETSRAMTPMIRLSQVLFCTLLGFSCVFMRFKPPILRGFRPFSNPADVQILSSAPAKSFIINDLLSLFSSVYLKCTRSITRPRSSIRVATLTAVVITRPARRSRTRIGDHPPLGRRLPFAGACIRKVLNPAFGREPRIWCDADTPHNR